jgi:hypothetical protein
MRAATCLCAALLALAATAAPAGAEPQVSAGGGFGSAANSYSWSMAWFKGKLYVGTARSQLCVEGATIDFYMPGSYKSPLDGFPEVDCPPDRYDMDLRAEIWQFDPAPGRWTRVYRSPADIPNPRAPGRFVARDIGFRNMQVHREPDGTRALYIAGVTTDEYIPELAATHPPRILRTTDGRRFRALDGAPGVLQTPFGPQRAMGYRAMASYEGRLFVTAGGGLTGDGVVLEVKDPASASPEFVQVSPPDLAVFELQTFDGALYAGAGDGTKGYSVWKSDGASPLQFRPLVVGGAGRGKEMTSVVSMHVFKRRLYVSASGWAIVFPSSELIRLNRDDSYDLVVGNPRFAPDGSYRYPISGLPDGYGNIFNGHFWRQETHGGALLMGTNDWSWAFRSWPIVGPLLQPEFGFDMYGTCDGTYWWPYTRTAFGAGLYNFGARTLASTSAGGFIGSANHARGTAVWRTIDVTPCLPANQAGADGDAGARVARRASAPAPQRLVADVQSCGTVLSWDRAPGARRYRVLRSPYRDSDVGVEPRAAVPPGPLADLAAAPVHPGATRLGLSVAGRPELIGTTRGRVLVDRAAQPGRRYAYRVVAGRARQSNTVLVPSARPAVTVQEALSAVRELRGDDRRDGLRAVAAARSGRVTVAQLARFVRAAHGESQALEDARDVVMRLGRRFQARTACGG